MDLITNSINSYTQSFNATAFLGQVGKYSLLTNLKEYISGAFSSQLAEPPYSLEETALTIASLSTLLLGYKTYQWVTAQPQNETIPPSTQEASLAQNGQNERDSYKISLNGSGVAAITSSITALPFGLSPLAGAVTGLLAQQILAPVVNPTVNTLETLSKTGKDTISSAVIELTNLLSCVSACVLYTQMPPSLEAPAKAITAGTIAYGVNYFIQKPLADKAGTLANQSFEKLTTAASLSFFAIKSFASWKALSYLQNDLELTNPQLAIVLSFAFTATLATNFLLNLPAEQQENN